MQDARGRAQQLFGGGLEELVARVGVQNVGQRLAGVAARRQAGARDHVSHFAPQQRDAAWRGAVGGGREQAQKAVFATHLPGGVEALDGDVVQVARPVHGGARSGLGHHQQFGPAGVGAHLGRQRREARGHDLGLDVFVARLAQDAQAGVGHDLQCVFAADGDKFVRTAAQKGEVVVGQPLQKGAAFVEFVLRDRRRVGMQCGHDVQHALARLGPVGHGLARIAQHTGEIAGQRRHARGLGHTVHLDMDEGLAAARAFSAQAL